MYLVRSCWNLNELDCMQGSWMLAVIVLAFQLRCG